MIIDAALEEVSLEKLMGVVSDELHLKLRKNKAEKKTSTMDELTGLIHTHLTLTNNQCQQVRINQNPLPELTFNGKKYSGMNQMSQARKLYKANKGGGSSSRSQSSVEEVVELMGKLHVSREQSFKLVTKFIARNRIPVTHDEETNEVIVGIIPDGV